MLKKQFKTVISYFEWYLQEDTWNWCEIFHDINWVVILKGSVTHLQNILGVLNMNNVIVAWNDRSWQQNMKWLNSWQ